MPELDPGLYDLDPSGQYPTLGLINGLGKTASLDSIKKHLESTYCGKLAFEFEHVPNDHERRWFCQYIENGAVDEAVPTSGLIGKKRILELLSRSEVFDQFMQKKFPQVKRYGLEGGESLVPFLDQLVCSMKGSGMKGAVIGMPHRGRLNLLADLFSCPSLTPTSIFSKVRGNSELPEGVPGQADVLSHLSCKVNLDGVLVNVLPNPSHLEAINPVAVGKTRAKQVYLFDHETRNDNCRLGDKFMCIQIHGDAAFCGQGIVMETLGISNLPHFGCGGRVHVIVNNQIGYTTPALNSRSSVYTSDIAKMINSPVIHVNGDFPEACDSYLNVL